MKEKLYDITIDHPLTTARRKALNQHIVRHAHLSENPVSYKWDPTAGEVLHISADPVTFEVKFYPKKVEVYGSAPLWARLLLTAKKKEQLRQEIRLILADTGFVAVQPEDRKQVSRTQRQRS